MYSKNARILGIKLLHALVMVRQYALHDQIESIKSSQATLQARLCGTGQRGVIDTQVQRGFD